MQLEKIPHASKGKEKLSKEELLPYISKLIENLLEDTVDSIESLKKGHQEIHSFSVVDEMEEKLPTIDEKRLKTMLKVLHNVPLISYNELEHNGFMYPLIQMQVLQQQVYNYCGYHMSHTLINFTNYLKSLGKTSYLENINSSASIWSFHRQMTDFLEDIANYNKMDRTKYPWRPTDIKHGDYERKYDMVFNLHNSLYKSTYSETDLVEVRKTTIEMQFGRFITEFDDLMLIQKQVDDFLHSKSKKPIKIFAFQLACTCHWVGLTVVAIHSQLFFYFFDSKNVNCYGLSREQIEQKVDEIDEERVKEGKVAWTPFKKTCQIQSMGDINILLKLVPDMFLRKSNIYEHIFKTNFKEQYDEYWWPTIVKPLEGFGRQDTGKMHDHLVEYLGDLKTFIHYMYHMTKGHQYLSNESKEGVLEVYLQIFSHFDRCLGTISRYKKGRELIEVWNETKKSLGSHFQPQY